MGGVIYKCVERELDSNGKVVNYTIEDEKGNKYKYSRQELLLKIHNRDLTVIGIGMTVDGLVVDTEIYKDWETKYPNLMLVTQEDVKNRHKYLLLGTLPEYDIDSKRVVVGVRSNNTIFDNTSTVFRDSLIEPDKKAVFSGNSTLMQYKYDLENWYDNVNINVYFKDIVVSNPRALEVIARYKYGVAISAENIVIKIPMQTKEIVDKILDIFKKQLNLIEMASLKYSYYHSYSEDLALNNNLFIKQITFITDDTRYDEIYRIVETKIKRFKLPKDDYKQKYTLLSYMLFLYSMWLTTNKNDARYKKLFRILEEKMKDIKDIDVDNVTDATAKRYIIAYNKIYKKFYNQIRLELY